MRVLIDMATMLPTNTSLPTTVQSLCLCVIYEEGVTSRMIRHGRGSPIHRKNRNIHPYEEKTKSSGVLCAFIRKLIDLRDAIKDKSWVLHSSGCEWQMKWIQSFQATLVNYDEWSVMSDLWNRVRMHNTKYCLTFGKCACLWEVQFHSDLIWWIKAAIQL